MPTLLPDGICDGALMVAVEDVLIGGALEVEPWFVLGLDGAAGEGEEDCEDGDGEGEGEGEGEGVGVGVGVFVDVNPTETVGVGAVAVDVATTTPCVTPCGVFVTTVVLCTSDCAG